ncbi:MAG: DUF427 domain-containing protein [Chloroflexi bacterium]|nr:MAG: DUF427 domain-containing protein [Chloroflexota bacterium]
MTLTIKEKQSETIIAEGEPNETVRVFEGNWYFAPDAVNMDKLHITERTYTCPYKGTCYWIDLETSDGKIHKNVGWVYRQPKKGYEFIKDQIAFYARNTGGTVAVNSDPTPSPLEPISGFIKRLLHI